MNEEKLVNLKNLNLLLVEDDVELLNKMHTIMSIFFKNVLTAKNGQEGYVTFLESKVDMVITDYVMPKMNGFQLCKNIREKNKKIPLAIMSNYTDKEKLLNVIPLSLAQYLVKPISYERLTELLIELIEKIEAATEKNYQINSELIYDRIEKNLKNNNQIITLTKNEATIIELFIDNKDRILSSDDIELCLYDNASKSPSAVKSLVYRLRKKLGKDTIINVPGFGYIYKRYEE